MNAQIPTDSVHGAVTPDDALLTPAEAALESGFSVKTIRNSYRSGDLRAFQPTPNGRVKIPRSALHAWLRRSASRSDLAQPHEHRNWGERDE